jgi:hypothetical protein
MRVRHRWLLLSVFVVAVVIAAGIVVSLRGRPSLATVSFLGYTNLPDAKVRSAVFVAHTEDNASTRVAAMWIEAAGPKDDKPHQIKVAFHYVPTESLRGRGYYLCIADEPLESSRWRASCRAYEVPLRARLLLFAIRHGRANWWGAIGKLPEVPGFTRCVDYSSPWVTNSHQPQSKP